MGEWKGEIAQGEMGISTSERGCGGGLCMMVKVDFVKDKAPAREGWKSEHLGSGS